MKSTTTIKSALGLTQEEIAMLLGVTRGRWSMYDSRKRNLPIAAVKQLASILSHLQNPDIAAGESKIFSEAEQLKLQDWLKQEYIKLNYKQQFLDKQMLALEKKRAECFAALEVVRFLEREPSESTAALLESIKCRALNSLDKYSLSYLQELQMKKEHLEIAKNSLEQRMKENLNDR